MALIEHVDSPDTATSSPPVVAKVTAAQQLQVLVDLPGEHTTGRPFVPLVQWAPNSCMHKLMHTGWRWNILAIALGMLLYFAVIVGSPVNGGVTVWTATFQIGIGLIALLECGVMAGYLDRQLTWSAVHHFDFWVVVAAIMIVFAMDVVLISPSAGLLAASILSKVMTFPAILSLLVAKDAAPGLPGTLRTLLVVGIWIVYALYLLLVLFGDFEESSREICIQFVQQRCQRAESIRQTGTVQTLLFLSRFAWLSFRYPNRCLILKGNVHVSILGATHANYAPDSSGQQEC